MAQRRDIRNAFVTELQNAVPASGNKGHVPNDDIKIEEPESDEDLPSIVYDDAERRYPINEASTAPTRISTDNNGNVENEYYGRLRELRFGVLFWFLDEDEKESCYESVLSYFEKYEDEPWDASSIQSDVEWVRVEDAQSEDDSRGVPARRGDRLLISIVYQREIKYPQGDGVTGDSIQQVDHEVDADDDGTTDATWTTT